MLIMDAEGAFINLKRYQALGTASTMAPDTYMTFTNFYEPTTNAYYNGRPIPIAKGTIQGCSLSSHFYDLGVKQLYEDIKTEGVRMIWMCDDLTATEKPKARKEWRNKIEKKGPKFGYILKPTKCSIVTKDKSAVTMFKELIYKGKLTHQEGARYSGAAIGSQTFTRNFIKQKLDRFNGKIRRLTRVTKTSPHATYSLYQLHTKHELCYDMRTAEIHDILHDTKKFLAEFAETIVGQKIVARATFQEISLPNAWGGISINTSELEKEAEHQRNKSIFATAALKKKMLEQEDSLPLETIKR